MAGRNSARTTNPASLRCRIRAPSCRPRWSARTAHPSWYRVWRHTETQGEHRNLDPVAVAAHVVQHGSVRRVRPTGAQRIQHGVARAIRRPHHGPGVADVEQRIVTVVGGDGGERPAGLERQVPDVGGIPSPVLAFGARIEELQAGEPLGVQDHLRREPAPVRVGHERGPALAGDECGGGRQVGERLEVVVVDPLPVRPVASGILGDLVDPDRQDLRVAALPQRVDRELGARDHQQVLARRHRREGPVVRDREDVEPRPLVVLGDGARWELAVGVGRVRVQRRLQPDAIAVPRTGRRPHGG